MAEVLVPVSLGGSGLAYTDGTGTRGMASKSGYGFATYLFPMLSEVMAACQIAVNSVSSSQSSAGAAAASATLALGYSQAAAASDASAAGHENGSATNAATASNAAAAANAATALVGAYPNGAATNVPRGLKQSGVGAITGGSGGTNGTYTNGTFPSSNFTNPPTFSYTVAGGVLTSVTMTGDGLYIGSAPSLGAPSFPGSNLVGASFVATPEFLVANTKGYWVTSADGRTLDAYKNVSGVATADPSVGSIFLKPAQDELFNSPGRENLWPDPFFTKSTLAGGFEPGADNPFTFSGGWTLDPAPAGSPYPDGKVLSRPFGSVATPTCMLYLYKLGLVAGDVFQMAFEAASESSSLAAGNYVVGQFQDSNGVNIGASFGLMVLSAGTPLNTTLRTFNSGNVTIPTGATTLKMTASLFGTVKGNFYSVQLRKGAVAVKPLDRQPVPRLRQRLEVLELQNPAKNNVLMRRTEFASSTTQLQGSSILNTTTAFGGFGQSLLTSGAPAGGFNALEDTFNWTVGSQSPSRIYAFVRTCASGSNPCAGRLVAEGYIDVDLSQGTAGIKQILLMDPATGLAKTVMPADLDTLYAVGWYGVTAAGGICNNMFVSRGTMPNPDPALNGWQIPSGGVGGAAQWAAIGGSFNVCIKHVLLTTPVIVWKPSETFANAVALVGGEQPPDLIAVPPKLFGVEGREMALYFDNIQHRKARDSQFRLVMSTMRGNFYPERWAFTPTATPVTQAATIECYRGQTKVSSAGTTITTVAASASPGDKKLHFMGDSITASQGYLQAILDIDATDPNSSVTLVGSVGSGSIKHNGYSGASSGNINQQTSPAILVNPFWDGAAFNYGYFITNSLGGVAPDMAMLFFGTNDMDPNTGVLNDDQATSRANAMCTTYETVITSILASGVKVGVMIPPTTAQEQDTVTNNSRDAFWRFARNMKILAQKLIAQFQGREASNIYLVPVGSAIDSFRGYGRKQYLANATYTVGATYANAAAMVLTVANGTLAYLTSEDRYVVKVGASGTGFWRDAVEADGIVYRHNDGVHPAAGVKQIAEAVWAFRKCNL